MGENPDRLLGTGVGELLRIFRRLQRHHARAGEQPCRSSGPQVSVDKDRLADGQVVAKLQPSDDLAVQGRPVRQQGNPIKFFQPKSNAAELNAVYDKFSTVADEVSSIPRYMMGDSQVGGAGRTAAGLSMLMNAANKGIKNVANNIDSDIIVPIIQRLFYYIMVYDDDESVKGDIDIVAKGASGLMLKELLNQRRLEFLQIVTPFVQSGLVPPEVLLEILTELAKGLEFPDGMLPTPQEFQAHLAQQQAQAQPGAPAAPGAAPPGAAPGPTTQGAPQSGAAGVAPGMPPKGPAPAKPAESQLQDQVLRKNFIPGAGNPPARPGLAVHP